MTTEKTCKHIFRSRNIKGVWSCDECNLPMPEPEVGDGFDGCMSEMVLPKDECYTCGNKSEGMFCSEECYDKTMRNTVGEITDLLGKDLTTKILEMEGTIAKDDN